MSQNYIGRDAATPDYGSFPDPASRMDERLDADVQAENDEIEDCICQQLDQLAELRAQTDAIRLEKQALKDSILTPELMAQLHDIDTEYADRETTAKEKEAELDMAIRKAVATYGDTVTGAHLQAVYVRGRVSWDTRALDGYAAGHPEIVQFRKFGDSSVSIRKR
jgi:hypothetical protein